MSKLSAASFGLLENTAIVTINRNAQAGQTYAQFHCSGTKEPREIVRAFIAAALKFTHKHVSGFSEICGIPRTALTCLLNYGSRTSVGDALTSTQTLIQIAHACGLELAITATPEDAQISQLTKVVEPQIVVLPVITLSPSPEDMIERAKAFGGFFRRLRGEMKQSGYGGLIGTCPVSLRTSERAHQNHKCITPQLTTVLRHQSAKYKITLELRRPIPP